MTKNSFQGRAPVLISDLDCDFQVEWLTEFACPEDTLVTRAECKLTKEPHGVDIDLTPLRNGPSKRLPTLVKYLQNRWNRFPQDCRQLVVRAQCAFFSLD